MTQQAPADGDPSNRKRQREADPVDVLVEQEVPADPERRNHQQRGKTMHRAKARKTKPDLVESAAERAPTRRRQGVRGHGHPAHM